MTDLHSSLSRRGALKMINAAALAGTIGAVAGNASADSANKAPQRAAGYQAQPNDGKKCADCAQFRAPDGCGIVQGPISPNGWCRLFRAKEG